MNNKKKIKSETSHVTSECNPKIEEPENNESKNSQDNNDYSRLKKVMEKVKPIALANNVYVYISALVVAITYLFFQLGYSFTYGYYFGGKSISAGKLMDVMVKQIPFDFKLVAIIGICILIFMACFVLSSYMYVMEKRIIIKIVGIGLHLLMLWALYTILLLLTGTQDANDTEIGNSINLVIILGVVIIISCMIKKICYSLNLDSVLTRLRKTGEFIIYLIFVFSINWDNLKLNKLNYTVILFFELVVVIGVLDQCFFYKKDRHVIIRCILSFFEIAPIIGLFLYVNIMEKIIFISVLIVYITAIKIEKLINKKNSSNSSQREKNKNKVLLVIIMLAMCSMILVLYLVAYSAMNFMGNGLGKTLHLNTESKITYYNIDNKQNCKVVYGVVVQQSGNTYYISSEDRELITITSPYVVIEPYDNKTKN
ncbi:hypothetical protein [Inconstantimicrobium mannanitabidum]|uniref:Uncharacterized protein n=1 Tax=Inconstantimicrobium mannanitabidum TaxID=1604901 RepID=A0ACB5RAG3_9CLOT|nr:hypothetical protein [Clostridium sp. TW13]GKX66019.1 hypothetical protein rsdtw13_12770 [Clostridium sp. TW13]